MELSDSRIYRNVELETEYVKITTNKVNGNLIIHPTNDGRKLIDELIEFGASPIRIIEELFESISYNSDLQHVSSVEIGALTACETMICDGWYNDDGYFEYDNLWWFPEYEWCDEIKMLLSDGGLELTLAEN